MGMQNTSHAVMAQRHEPSDSPDDFPTPPWATRALIEHVIDGHRTHEMSCLEPACGRGYMSRPLSERFQKVESADLLDYGYGEVRDFLSYPYLAASHDWVITNPPFKLAQEFIERSLLVATEGVAILARTVFLESIGRYQALFKHNPPTYFAQFSERVPMIKGRVDPKASTATGYAWFVWVKSAKVSGTQLVWIPPCRRKLEKADDYA
jgi:hypothetical protein